MEVILTMELGVAGSITTFSAWMEEGYISFANFENYQRGGLYDVCP